MTIFSGRGQNRSIPTLTNPSHTTRLSSPDRAVRTGRAEVVPVDAARASTDHGARGQRREGSCAAIAAHKRSAKETSAAGMGLTPLPRVVRAIHLCAQATARLHDTSGRPASNERAILRRARPQAGAYSHAERLALLSAFTQGRARPCHLDGGISRTASGRSRVAILVLALREMLWWANANYAGRRAGSET